MKKCKCGKDIDDRWDLCFKCNQENLQKTGERPPMAKQDRDSIERQQAMICTSRILEGHDSTEESIVRTFNVCLKLIRG